MKVLVVYSAFPHYRRPVMLAMQADPRVQYTFAGGEELSLRDSVPVINPGAAAESGLPFWPLQNHWLARDFLLWQSGLLRLCLSPAYQAVIFLGHPYHFSVWAGALAARWSGKRVLFWAHAILRSRRRDRLKKFFFHLADALLLYGNDARLRLEKAGFDPRRLFVIYNSLDVEAQTHALQQITAEQRQRQRATLFENPQWPVLVFVGRLTPQKKLPLLLQAASRLQQAGQPVNILLVGAGPEQPTLQALAVDLGLKVHFWGECYEEAQLALLFSLADICVSPGNVGLTALHALAYGTPVITHADPLEQMPEFEAIQPGKTGQFFQPENLASLTETLSQWLKTHQTDREELRTICRDSLFPHYTPAFQAQAIFEALERICSHAS